MKMSFRKIMCLLLVCVISASVFSGCAKQTATSDTVSVSVGNWPNAETNAKNFEVYKGKLENFSKKYPDIRIIPDEWRYDVKTFLPKAEGGTLPNLYNTHFTETKKIIDLGYASDITNAMKKNGYYEKINEYIYEMISKNGKIYMVPKSCYSLGLVLNLELFKEAGLMQDDGTPIAPKTFEELIKTARIITEKTGKAGFIFPTTDNAGGWNFTVLAWNFGTKFMEKIDGKWKATFDTPECVAALQYLKDLKWKYNVLPATSIINNAEMLKLFSTNQGAMSFNAPSATSSLIANYAMNKDGIGIASMPAGPAKHVTLLGGSFMVVAPNSTDDQIDAAFKWLEYENITPNLTEERKKSLRDSYELLRDENKIIGISELSVWNEKSDIESFRKQIVDELCNININHVRLFNEATDIELQTEEPVCAQDLYSILDGCIQAVFTDKNADCATLISKAAKDFQNNFLDYEN